MFLDRLPAASAMQALENTNLITWSYLRSNETYRVESAAALGTWTTGVTFQATGVTHVTADPADDGPRFYRINMQ